VLRELERVKRSPFVFPSRRKTREPRPVGEFRKPWNALLKAAKIPAAMPYVLRHTYASESESLGHSHYLTAALLGHSMAGGRDMTRGYVHHVATEVRSAGERVARRIAAALDGESVTDNVVPIRG
jgi:integrase